MSNDDPGNVPTVRLTAVVHGMVQGVGFRYLTARQAAHLSLAGSAVNSRDGSVVVTAEGPAGSVQELLDWLQSPQAPGTVTAVEATFGAASGRLSGFQTG
jgi:acylphosphatase